MGNNLPKRWTPGTKEPKYEDGVTKRHDFENKKGLRLAAYEWAVPKGIKYRGAVILVHGIDTHVRWDYLKHSEHDQFGESTYFSPKYEGSWVQTLNNAGYAAYGVDMTSYGASEGPRDQLRAYFDDFQDLVDDVLSFQKFVAKLLPKKNKSVFLVGGSMGGCIATRVAEQANDLFAGLILLAPMLSLEQLKKKPINTILLPLSEVVSKNLPTLAIAAKQPNTAYPREEEQMKQDVLSNAEPIRARVAQQCLKAVEDTRSDLQSIKAPSLVFHSPADTMCDIEGSRFFIETISSEDKTMVELDEYMWHVLTSEPGNEEVLAKIVEWLESRT